MKFVDWIIDWVFILVYFGLSCVNEEIMMFIYKYKFSFVFVNVLVVYVFINFKIGGNLRSM